MTPVHQAYLLQARQMQALSFAVHIPLVCFGIAFPAMILFVEWLCLRSGDELYRTLARRWTRVLVALFAVGVITGTILSSGAVILFPSLGLLFRLVLAGQLDHGAQATASPLATAGSLLSASAPGFLARLAGACLLSGFGLLTVAEAGWAHAVGVLALLSFIVCGFLAAVPSQLANIDDPASGKST
jgi:Cytochrome bd terminal oxidase subunit I